MEYKDKCKIMEDRLNEVNALSHESQAQLGDSTEVLRELEAKLRHSEVRFSCALQIFYCAIARQCLWVRNPKNNLCNCFRGIVIHVVTGVEPFFVPSSVLRSVKQSRVNSIF